MITKTLFILSLCAYIAGVTGSLPLGIAGVHIYFIDVVAILSILYWAIRFVVKREPVRITRTLQYYFFFIAAAVLSDVLSPLEYDTLPLLTALMYLGRITAYASFFLTAEYIVGKKGVSDRFITSSLISGGAAMAVLGWVQYFLYPDLRNLEYLGWDPHLGRIFSTILDPNYFGILMFLACILTVTGGIRQNFMKIVFTGLFLSALSFTYSRSTYLVMVVSGLYYAVKSKNMIYIILTVFLVTSLFIFLPKPYGESANLYRVFSITERVGNWKEGMDLFARYPITGIGYNRLRQMRSEQQHQKGVNGEIPEQSHSAGGFDNSFIYIAATSGIAGLFALLVFLRYVFTYGNTTTKLSLLAIVIHSFFLNTLFFPWVLYWLLTVAGMDRKLNRV